MKTAAQVKEEMKRAGVTISAWARAHGFSREIVARVLAEKGRSSWGQSHEVAVLLGLKDGTVMAPKNFTAANTGKVSSRSTGAKSKKTAPAPQAAGATAHPTSERRCGERRNGERRSTDRREGERS